MVPPASNALKLCSSISPGRGLPPNLWEYVASHIQRIFASVKDFEIFLQNNSGRPWNFKSPYKQEVRAREVDGSDNRSKTGGIELRADRIHKSRKLMGASGSF